MLSASPARHESLTQVHSWLVPLLCMMPYSVFSSLSANHVCCRWLSVAAHEAYLLVLLAYVNNASID
jgi:hypothetical protein